MRTEWTPRNLMIAGSGVLAAVLVLPNLDKGLSVLLRWMGTTEKAYAAFDAASDVRSDFDEYIHQQERALELEQERLRLQAEYNKQLMAIQQQQHPAAASAPPSPTQSHGAWFETDSQGRGWCCDALNQYDCREGDWYACE